MRDNSQFLCLVLSSRYSLILGVQLPKLADASACQLALLLRELVNPRVVLARTKLPLSKRSRLKFRNDKTISKIFSTVRLQPQQMCDDNARFMNDENCSWCTCMVSQSSPVITRVTRGLSALRRVTLLQTKTQNPRKIFIYPICKCVHQHDE